MYENDDPRKAIADYHTGFITNSPQLVRSVLGAQFMMVNGNYSDEPTDWQAHMFLSGADLDAWPGLFLQEAGPYQNEFECLHVDVRGKAAVVVTQDNGQNRFRSWEAEVVTWWLGEQEGGWKIIGMFIRDIRNPE